MSNCLVTSRGWRAVGWVPLVGALILFLLADSHAMHVTFTSRYPGANDFYARWAPVRAWLFEGRSPYADSVTLETQVGMYGRPARPDEDQVAFAYPFFSILFFGLPALISSYAWASAVWTSSLQVALLALVALSMRWSGWRPPAWLFRLTLIFGLFWYHSARTLILGQFAALEALLIVGGLLMARASRDAWAGVLLALAMVKPQMVFLVLPGLLLWSASLQRWALPLGFAGTMAVLLGASFLLLPAWFTEWLRHLRLYADYTFTVSPVAIMVRALFPGAGGLPEWLLSGLLVAYLLWIWWLARGQTGRRFDWAVALTLVVTNLVAVRTATTNYVMMFPALFVGFGHAQEAWGSVG